MIIISIVIVDITMIKLVIWSYIEDNVSRADSVVDAIIIAMVAHLADFLDNIVVYRVGNFWCTTRSIAISIVIDIEIYTNEVEINCVMSSSVQLRSLL